MATPLQQKKQILVEFQAVCDEVRSALGSGLTDYKLCKKRLDVLTQIVDRYNGIADVLDSDYNRWGKVDQLVKLRVERDRVSDEYGRVRDLLRWKMYGVEVSLTENPYTEAPVRGSSYESKDADGMREAYKLTEEKVKLQEQMDMLKKELQLVERSLSEMTVKAVGPPTYTEVKQPFGRPPELMFPHLLGVKGQEPPKPPPPEKDVAFEPNVYSTPVAAGALEARENGEKVPAMDDLKELSRGLENPKPPDLDGYPLIDFSAPEVQAPVYPYASQVSRAPTFPLVDCPPRETESDLPPLYRLLQTAQPRVSETAMDATQPSMYGVADPVKFINKIQIPKFSGDKKEFADWWAAFKACIDLPQLPPAVRMLKLRECLQKPAIDCVRDLGYSEEAFQVAKDRLFKKYGGSRRKIAMLCEELAQFRQIRDGVPSDLERLAELLDRLVVNLVSSTEASELGSGYMYSGILRKLTPGFVSKYERWLYDRKIKGTVIQLKEFVNQEADFLTVAAECTQSGYSDRRSSYQKKDGAQKTYYSKNEPSTNGPGGSSFNRSAGTFRPRTTPNIPRVCKNCEITGHGIWECERFKKLPLGQRDSRRKELRLCFKCLGPHSTESCWRRRSCAVQGCKKPHHELLHGIEGVKTPYKSPELGVTMATSSQELGNTDVKTFVDTKTVDTKKKTANASTHFTKDQPVDLIGDDFMSFRTVPVYLCNDGRRIKVNALLDDASNRSYVSQDAAYHLHLMGEDTTIHINSVMETSRAEGSQTVECTIQNMDKSVSEKFTALTLPRVADGLVVKNLNKLASGWKHLDGIIFPQPAGSKVDVLIGLDHLDLMGNIEEVHGLKGQPKARLTPLGWTCVGDWTLRQPVHTFFTHVSSGQSRDDELHMMISRLWEMEEPKSQNTYTKLEQDALDQVEKSCVKLDGRFCVGMPWKGGKRPENINNYYAALRRLKSTEKTLVKKGPMVVQEYQKTFDGYTTENIITKVKLKDPAKFLKGHFLAHFPIVRSGVSTTKVRPVYDASGKDKGVCLNDFLLPGPKLQKDLVVVMLGFRRNAVAVKCDVKQMYLQILMALEDQDLHMFLWRGMETNRDPDIYKFQRLVFGSSSSPFLAQYVSRKNAMEFVEKYPEAARMILERTFMDDGLDSVHTVEVAVKLICEVNIIWANAKMEVHKWLSNSAEVLKSLPAEKRDTKVDLTRHELPLTKSLGTGWNAQTDELCFQSEVADKKTPETKREFLSTLSTVYDPLGLVSPVLMRGKTLLQRTWVSGKEWDETLPPSLLYDITEWVNDVKQLVMITVPRMLVPGKDYILYLHMAGDASEEGLGAVVHSVAIKLPDEIYTNLVASKTKVAPLTAINVPRLELQAALVGSELLDKVASALEVPKSQCYCWTDSMDVWHWIHSLSREYKAFVQNRIADIQRLTLMEMWGYIPTQQNPADVLSRGATTSELADHHLWFTGAPFYTLPKEDWPRVPAEKNPAPDKEKRKQSIFTMVTMCKSKYVEKRKPNMKLSNTRLNPDNWSKMSRLVRVTAYVRRALLKFKDKNVTFESVLTASELADAQLMLLRESQSTTFPQEVKDLLEGREISSKSEILFLKPWLDEDGLLRANTRLSQGEEIPWDVKYPVILGHQSRITKLIIMQEHENLAHSGTGAVLTSLLQKYWLLRPRETIKNVLHWCYSCRRWKGKPFQPEMAPLPSDRIDKSGKPFSVSSVDFAGPFFTKAGRGKQQNKRYLCVYNCLHTRAVHLEIVYDMSAQGFLLALSRIVNRRDRPRIVYSDNGSNFVGGVRELEEFDVILKSNEVQEVVGNYKIDWKFNPPSAPHFNGVHEVMVRGAKRALVRVVGTASLTDEELMTATTDVERILNNRPLTYQVTDEKDLTVLTPNHFLIGQMCQGLVEDDAADTGQQLRLRWQHVQHLVTQVWARWMREWLVSLSPRHKWLTQDRDLRIGDIVLCSEPGTARGRWPIGRITKVFPGSDGVVRVVEVASRGMLYRRPAVKLCRLLD